MGSVSLSTKRCRVTLLVERSGSSGPSPAWWVFSPLVCGLARSRCSQERSSGREPWGYLVVGVAVALLVGAGVGVITDSTDERLLEVTMVTDALEGFVVCSDPGFADEITVGEVELVFHNQATTGGTGWMGVVRLDEGKTVSDMVGHIESGVSGIPDWTTRVHLSDDVPIGASTVQVTKTVQPGLHTVSCGTSSPHESQLAGAFTVLP